MYDICFHRYLIHKEVYNKLTPFELNVNSQKPLGAKSERKFWKESKRSYIRVKIGFSGTDTFRQFEQFLWTHSIDSPC